METATGGHGRGARTIAVVLLVGVGSFLLLLGIGAVFQDWTSVGIPENIPRWVWYYGPFFVFIAGGAMVSVAAYIALVSWRRGRIW